MWFGWTCILAKRPRMANAERRTVEELVARYELERDIRDLYVEGRTDACVISWFLRTNGISDVVVYEIATVDVPLRILSKNGQRNNNIGKVESLALELVT